MIRVKILLRKELVKIPGVMSDKSSSGQIGSRWVMGPIGQTYSSATRKKSLRVSAGIVLMV
jgi:hypothetical protein